MAASSTSRAFTKRLPNGVGAEFVDLSEREIAPEVLRFIPSGLARLHGALPIDVSDNDLAGGAGGSARSSRR